MKYFWMRWYQPGEDYRPLSFPPNESILGWWCSGRRGDEDNTAILVALVKASDEAAAVKAVAVDWPEHQLDFCQELEPYPLSDRFPIPADSWMAKRVPIGFRSIAV